MPQRITFLVEGMPYPEKPITVRCTVMSNGLLPEERVTIARETGTSAVDQGQEMNLVIAESGKRVYEAIIDPLPVGEHTFSCHVSFASDDHENIKRKFGTLYTTSVDSLSGKNVVDMGTALYVRVKDDQIVTSGLSGVKLEKEELIRSIGNKQLSDLPNEALMTKSIVDLEGINGGPMRGNSAMLSSGQTTSQPVPRPKEIMADYVRFVPKGRTLPKKPITMQCTVTSAETLPEERVTIIKEMYDNVVIQEENLTLTDAKPGQRIYEYATEPLPAGDYKFKCNVHYVSDDYKSVSRKYDKKDVHVNKRADGQYEIDLVRSWYVVVREDEVVTSGSDFEHIEKDQLIRQIHKKIAGVNYLDFLKKSLGELEAINGEALPKYKTFGASRPK